MQAIFQSYQNENKLHVNEDEKNLNTKKYIQMI